jgi:CDP-diacylglycerol--inositol 3-phosphatidyltransferase
MHMYATLAMGGNQSHKTMDSGRPWAMRLYYTDKVSVAVRFEEQTDQEQQRVLFAVCAFNELFFIALYLLSFSSSPLTPYQDHPDGSFQSAKPTAPSLIWPTPFSAGAMEMAR